jgi:N-acyl-L-homoserine lactone synthetase
MSTVEEQLHRIDRVAGAVVRARAPVQFARATTDAERAEVYALRYRTVVAEGWVAPAALPDGVERDAHDERAVHLVGRDGDVLAATARLVFPSATALLPTEEAFGVRLDDCAGVVDLGRGIVAPAYRGRGHLIFFALLAAVWLEARTAGFTRVCGTTAPAMLPHYRQMGFHVEVLGASRVWWGEERIPVLMDGTRASATALEQLVKP